VIRLIDETLEDEGYTVATEHVISLKDGVSNLGQFLTNHQPALILFDLSPPYQQNWNFLQLLRKIPMVQRIPIVLTTVNKVALEKTVGKTDAFELMGTREDLAPIVAEINRLTLRRHAGQMAAVVGSR
jgi:CheY-like chemotaxis protein